MSKIKLAGKSISEILKRIKRAQRNKRATKNQEKAGLSVKSIKPFNYRAGARDEQIVPVKKQSQKGSSFQPHRLRGKQSSAAIRASSEGSAASWRDEMERMYGDIKISEFFKKSTGGDINKPMNKKLSEKQMKIARMAEPRDKITGADFKAMKARTGKAIKADPTKPISSVAPKVTDALKKKRLPGRIGTALGIGAMMVPAAYAAAKQYKDYKSAKNRDKAKVKKYSLGGDILTQFKDIMTGSKDSKISKAKENLKKQIAEGRAKMRDKAKVKKYSVGGGADASRKTFPSMAAMREAKGFKPGETPAQFNKRRMMLEGAKKAAKATKIGKIAAGIGAVGVAASQFLKKKMEEKKENKKMVGGMAKKYSKGGDLRLDYIDRQTRLNQKATGKKNYIAESKKTRREEYGAAKDRYPTKTDKLRGVAKRVGSLAPFMPTVSIAKGVYDKLSKSSAEKYSKGGGADTGTAGERRSRLLTAVQRASRRRQTREGFTSRPSPKRTPRGGPMGSIMPERLSKQDILFTTDKSFLKDMKPPSGAAPGKFKSGTMVKARGCKLGRTRPTKIT